MRESSEIARSDPSAPVFSIGTVARMLAVSVYTPRMYEREGLIVSYKAESNQRRYSQADVERLKCIRRAINDLKYSIPAVKAIYSLISCWEIVKCSEGDRADCEAYKGYSRPCWTYQHENNICGQWDCRECDVYRLSTDCGNIKQSIQASRA